MDIKALAKELQGIVKGINLGFNLDEKNVEDASMDTFLFEEDGTFFFSFDEDEKIYICFEVEMNPQTVGKIITEVVSNFSLVKNLKVGNDFCFGEDDELLFGQEAEEFVFKGIVQDIMSKIKCPHKCNSQEDDEEKVVIH